MAKTHTTAALYGENAAAGDVKRFPELYSNSPMNIIFPKTIFLTKVEY